MTHDVAATRLGSLQAHSFLVPVEGVVEVDRPLLKMSSTHQDGATRGHLSAAGSGRGAKWSRVASNSLTGQSAISFYILGKSRV